MLGLALFYSIIYLFKMTVLQLSSYVKECINDYPSKSEEIKDIYYLALSEIEEGGSVEHECHLAINDIQEIISRDKVSEN